MTVPKKVTQKAKPKPKKKTSQRDDPAALARATKQNKKKGGRDSEKKPARRRPSVEGGGVTHIHPDTGKMGTFGPGTVIEFSGPKGNRTVTVDFDSVGEKKVKEQYLEGLPR
jgi:hypothetical protein